MISIATMTLPAVAAGNNALGVVAVGNPFSVPIKKAEVNYVVDTEPCFLFFDASSRFSGD